MEKEKRMKSTVLFLLLAIVVLLACLAVFGVLIGKIQEEQKTAEDAYRTFADWTEQKEFQDVPALQLSGTKIEDVYDYGDGTYGIVVNGTELQDYKDYLDMLANAEFQRVVDNGETGLEETIYTASFTKETITLTVTWVKPSEKLYIMACENMPLSEHLTYKEEYIVGNKKDAKTTLHMLEGFQGGDNIVFQLKNGHFIVNDGGQTPGDLAYLVEYLETLVPEGEKPVIEAWFISHAHADHYGALISTLEKQEYVSRILVNGIYFNVPNQDVFASYSADSFGSIAMMKLTAKVLRTSSGEVTPIYRPQSGQRYYFNDITIDIVHTQEQLHRKSYSPDLNDSSMWCMYTVDGEKLLLSGDADKGSVDTVMRTYDSSYFDIKLFKVFHHGINVWNAFTDFIQYDIALYPSYRIGSTYADGTMHAHSTENAYIVNKAKESFAYGKGSVVLEFPYELGSGKILPAIDWTEYTTLKREWTDGWEEKFEVYNKNY